MPVPAPEPDVPWAVRRQGATVTNSDAVWPWWSFTKTALAAAVLSLHERGGIELDAPTRFYPATPRQLLAHRGGVPSYTGLAAYRAAVERRAPAWPFEEMLARALAAAPDFAPGEGWAYSNSGYAILRRVIEEASDSPIEAAVGDLVFRPLGLRNTAVVVSTADDHCPLLRAEGYDPAWVYHGLACGPAADAVGLLDGLFEKDRFRLVAQSLVADPTDLGGAVAERPWSSAAYGLGVMCGTMVGTGPVVGHSGGGPFSVSATYRTSGPVGPRSACAFAGGRDEAVAEWAVQRLLTDSSATAS